MLQEQLVRHLDARIKAAHLPLGVTLWNGERLTPSCPSRVRLTVRSPWALTSLLRPTMGRLARDYVEERIDIDGDARDVTRIGEALSSDLPAAGARRMRWRPRHSRSFDQRSIAYHYDVGNDFYGLWLDRQRVYSCAYFRTEADTLDEAQQNKLDHICRKLRLAPGQRLLDVGCGWGALILRAVQRYGVRATGITLSANQHEYVTRLIRELNVADRCEVLLMDYRDLPEEQPYDRIVSVGMFEHVGRENLSAYFAKLYRLLQPGGLLLNHGITLNSVRAGGLGSDIGDFMDEYVFPGGQLCHISEVIHQMAGQGLESWDVENWRVHYGRTLWNWVDRLDRNRAAAVRLVGEKTYRIWRIYMAGSAHAFERGWLAIYQILAGKPLASGALGVPATRDYIYAL